MFKQRKYKFNKIVCLRYNTISGMRTPYSCPWSQASVMSEIKPPKHPKLLIYLCEIPGDSFSNSSLIKYIWILRVSHSNTFKIKEVLLTFEENESFLLERANVWGHSPQRWIINMFFKDQSNTHSMIRARSATTNFVIVI